MLQESMLGARTLQAFEILRCFHFMKCRESLERLSIDSLTQVGGPLTVIRSCYGEIAIC